MITEELQKFQELKIKNDSFRKTKLGRLFYDYENKQARSERYDAKYEYADNVNMKKLREYNDAAKAAKEEFLNMLHQLAGIT